MLPIREPAQAFYQTIRPVSYRTGIDDYPYWGSGTCFMLRHNGKSVLLIAKHLVDKSQIDNLFIIPDDDLRNCLPLNQMHSPIPHDTNDTDLYDLSVLVIDNQALANQFPNVAITIFEKIYKPATEIEPGARLMAVGIPNSYREFDYETKTMKFTRFECRGTFVGAASQNGCFEMKLSETQPASLTSLDGFSGSPVFVDIGSDPEKFKPRFVGMALRGTIESGKLFFLGSDAINQMLNDICK